LGSTFLFDFLTFPLVLRTRTSPTKQLAVGVLMLRTLSQPEAEPSRIPGDDQGPEKCPEDPSIPALTRNGEEFRSRELCEAGRKA